MKKLNYTFYLRSKKIVSKVKSLKICENELNEIIEVFAKDYELKEKKFSFQLDDDFMICDIDVNFKVSNIKKVNLVDFINNIPDFYLD